MKLKSFIKTVFTVLIFFAVLYIHPETILAQEAEQLDVTITSSNKDCSKLQDNSHSTTVSFEAQDTITITSETAMGGIYVKFNDPVQTWTLSYNDKTEIKGEYGFLHEYAAFSEDVTSCTITLDNAMAISEITAYSKGTLPSDVQLWKKPCEGQTDILVFSTHADDEILFLGGVLATYAGQQHLNVQVCYMTNYWDGDRRREHEKLDGLWESGVRHYPVNSEFWDKYAESIEGALNYYSYDDVLNYITTQVRRFKPMVVVTQDLNGEYGHGGHMLLAKTVCEAVDNSNDSSFCTDSVTSYGVWDTPKTYLHLYGENKLTMDLRQPLSNMNGRTAVEVAKDAYLKHDSQQWCWFYVSDEYEYSCADFGLYRTTVGTDTGNDMLENIVTYEEQAKIKEAESKKAEEESRSKEQERLALESKKASDELKANTQTSNNSNSNDKFIIILIIVVLVLLILVIALFVYKAKIEKKRRKTHRRRR